MKVVVTDNVCSAPEDSTEETRPSAMSEDMVVNLDTSSGSLYQ